MYERWAPFKGCPSFLKTIDVWYGFRLRPPPITETTGQKQLSTAPLRLYMAFLGVYRFRDEGRRSDLTCHSDGYPSILSCATYADLGHGRRTHVLWYFV